MSRDFTNFKKYFKEYQKHFGLTGYKVYFKYEPLEHSFAQITMGEKSQVITVGLNSDLPDKDKPFKDIKGSAKHEAIHLLLYRLESNARWRYSSKEEIDESVEELVVKLEELIDGHMDN